MSSMECSLYFNVRVGGVWVDREKLESFLESVLERDMIVDGTIAADESQAKAIWRIREVRSSTYLFPPSHPPFFISSLGFILPCIFPILTVVYVCYKSNRNGKENLSHSDVLSYDVMLCYVNLMFFNVLSIINFLRLYKFSG